MSTLSVSNITDGTTTVGTSYVVNGSAKAWVNFNGQGTIAARDSFNHSSLVDDGTGAYKAYFSTVFASTGYSISGSIRYNSGVANDGVFTVFDQLAGYAHVLSVYGGTLFDSNRISITAHGDLA